MYIPLESEFFERCAAQQRYYRTGTGNVYTEFLGDYDTVPFVGTDDDAVTVTDYMAEYLHQRLEAPRNRPVLAIDVGGGAGVEFLRYGAFFMDAIKAGELALLVSSVGSGPLEYMETALRYRDSRGLSLKPVAEAMYLYQRFGHTVTYIQANFQHGLGMGMQQGDKVSSLECSFDIVHEHKAVTGWNRAPEPSIIRLGELVAPEGVYMVLNADLHGGYGYMNSYGTTRDSYGTPDFGERMARARGIKAAHIVLNEQMGLRQVDVAEEGPFAGSPLTYRVFAGKDALPIAPGSLLAA
jgi:hypothetical protein